MPAIFRAQVSPTVAIRKMPLPARRPHHRVQRVIMIGVLETRQKDLAGVNRRIKDRIPVDVRVDNDRWGRREDDAVVKDGNSQRGMAYFLFCDKDMR